MVGKGRDRGRRRTFSIALLVRTPLDSLLPLLPLGIDALLCDAVLDASEAGSGVVALLAGLLAVGAGVLDLAAFGAHLGEAGGEEGGAEGVHVHGHGGIYGHGGLGAVHVWIELVEGVVVALVVVGVDVRHRCGSLGAGVYFAGPLGGVEGGQARGRGHVAWTVRGRDVVLYTWEGKTGTV